MATATDRSPADRSALVRGRLTLRRRALEHVVAGIVRETRAEVAGGSRPIRVEEEEPIVIRLTVRAPFGSSVEALADELLTTLRRRLPALTGRAVSAIEIHFGEFGLGPPP